MSALAPTPPIDTTQTADATASQSRAEINRNNALHSTGPRTPEGKARASMNALKHGLFSAEVLLPGEDRGDFESLVRQCTTNFHAETEQELSLVQDIVDSRCRMQRVVARETALIILTTEQQRATVENMFDADYKTITALAQAAGFQANSRLFSQLSTAEARLHRRGELAGKKLAELVQTRQMSALIEPEAKPDMQLAGVRPPVVDSGFVPPLSPEPMLPSNMPNFTGPLKKENRRQWLRKHGYNQIAKAA